MASDNPSPLAAQILAKLEEHNLVNYHDAVPSALFRASLDSSYSAASIAELGELTSIKIEDKGIDDFSGIEYAYNVSKLSLHTNRATQPIDISALASITELRLYYNSFTSIGKLTNLTSMTYLRVDSNSELTDVGDLTNLTLLTYLWCYNNKLTDIGSVAGMTVLTSLIVANNLLAQLELETMIDELWANRVALGANSCVINMVGNTGSAAAAASRASEIADLIAEGCSVTI